MIGVPVHLRVCGEQRRVEQVRVATDGSSPRVRGTDRQIDGSRHRPRFIPACAGNSNRLGHKSKCGTVHPRVCGEQTKVADDVVD